MRTLLLLRHAKAEIGSLGIADIDRRLMPRGQKAAERMGQYMAEVGLKPDHVICSSAERTRETAAIVLPQLGSKAPLVYEPLIYEAPYERILSIIHRAPSSARTLMLVGHNPGLEDLVDALMMTAEKEAERKLREKFPTCALAVLTFPQQHWADVNQHSGHLQTFVTPRALAERR